MQGSRAKFPSHSPRTSLLTLVQELFAISFSSILAKLSKRFCWQSTSSALGLLESFLHLQTHLQTRLGFWQLCSENDATVCGGQQSTHRQLQVRQNSDGVIRLVRSNQIGDTGYGLWAVWSLHAEEPKFKGWSCLCWQWELRKAETVSVWKLFVLYLSVKLALAYVWIQSFTRVNLSVQWFKHHSELRRFNVIPQAWTADCTGNLTECTLRTRTKEDGAKRHSLVVWTLDLYLPCCAGWTVRTMRLLNHLHIIYCEIIFPPFLCSCWQHGQQALSHCSENEVAVRILTPLASVDHHWRTLFKKLSQASSHHPLECDHLRWKMSFLS